MRTHIIERIVAEMRAAVTASRDYKGLGIPVQAIVEATITEWADRIEAAIAPPR